MQPIATDPHEVDLKDITPPFDSGPRDALAAFARPATHSGPVTAHFGDVKAALLDFIHGSDALVGCVAWLTDFDILDALAEKSVALVVQKEDFLRPDVPHLAGLMRRRWHRALQGRYDKLMSSWERHQFPAPLGLLSVAEEPLVEGVRCAGNHNTDRHPAAPRMHHKFLVDVRPVEQLVCTLAHAHSNGFGCYRDRLAPTRVWTGSFNFARSAGLSLENALEIRDAAIADAYFQEWNLVESISEPLDWDTAWAEPQWRVGT